VSVFYSYKGPGGSHWSLRVRRGTLLTATDTEGGANLAALFYNPENLLEKYNAPDTLKCQHSFKVSQGMCLYSDMGRIFASVVEDTLGWHDTVCGNSQAADVTAQWGARDYQRDRNLWLQNGTDSFLVELAKYGLGLKDVAANVNFFSRVVPDEAGKLQLQPNTTAGARVSLRFDMDTLLILHTCPHPLNTATDYPRKPVLLEFSLAPPVREDDSCITRCDENRRGYANNQLYYFGATP
jgi:urea carboxylase-associated protein 2